MDSGFKPTLILMSGRTVAFAATFFIPVVLTRIFSQADFGTYKQLFLIYATLYSIAQCGMAESLFYFVPRAPRQAGRYVANAMLFLAAAGLGCFALLATTESLITRWLSNGDLAPYLTSLGAFLVLMMVSAVLEIAIIAHRGYRLAASSYGVSDLLRAALFVVPVLFVPHLESLLLGAVAYAALRLTATIVYLSHAFKGDLRPDPARLRAQLRYAAPFGIAILFEIMQSSFHQYAVSYHFDAATFAVYAVGCLQIPFVDSVVTSAGNVMMVRMSDEVRDGRTETVLSIWHDTIRDLALVCFPVVGVLLVTARELIVSLFTPSYAASVPIFMVWSTEILLAVLRTDGVLRVYAETPFILTLNALRLGLIVLLIGRFVESFGLMGAVLVTILAGVVAKGLALARIARLMRVGARRVVPWRTLAAILAIATGAGLVAWVARAALELPAVPTLFVTGLVYAGTYLGLVLQVGLLRESERVAIAGWVRRLTGGVRRGGAGVLWSREASLPESGSSSVAGERAIAPSRPPAHGSR